MRKKCLKVLTVILLLALLTMPNFIYVGTGLVSYAVSNIATSHQNIEFDAELKEGNILSLSLNVKREGYFNGEITLGNSNFIFDTETSNEYINKIEDNKIVLNQINADTTAQIDLKIKPMESDNFDIGLLDVISTLNLLGIYRDSTERDIKITATREVEFKYTEDNTDESVENSAKIITNKIIKVSGEDKRVIQLEMNLGLKENNYPIKEIEMNMDVPVIDGKTPKIVSKVDFNNMTHFDINYENNAEKSTLAVKYTNDPKDENKVRWIKQGSEKVILSFIYDKDVTMEGVSTLKNPVTKVTLYNNKQLTKVGELKATDLVEEKEELVNVTTTNNESTIYKGKLNAGIDRKYESKTKISVNLANAEQYIKIKENSDNSVFNKTLIKKDKFDELFGENGQITILNENEEVLATINNRVEPDESGNIVIDYTQKEPKIIEIRTSTPIKEGNIEFVNTKTIKAENKEEFKNLTELNTKTTYVYNQDELKETKAVITLEEANTEADLILSRDTLSTIVENNVEIKAILKGNNEKFNLYKNPVISFELPSDIESLELAEEPKIMYDNELRYSNSEINGRTITVFLQGEQTEYKNTSIDGAILILNANIIVNKKASSKDANVNMTVQNGEQQASDSKGIRIVAPKDVTAVNSIMDLNIETIGQDELKTATLQRGTNAKQLETSIEVINNNENAIENVRIMGTFPTKSKENNMNVNVIDGINIEGADVYYTENEEATEDINNTANLWKNEITDGSKVRKYLIVVQNIDKQSSISGAYKFEVPELLEYNQSTTEGYIVKYTNTLTRLENEVKSTNIKLETGIGPVLEAKLIPTIGGAEVNPNTTVKNGEVIKYKIEVSNTGSVPLENVLITSNIPEGTTLVKPQDNYEYTGASYYKELSNKTYEAKIDSIGIGEVKKGEFEVRVKSDTQPGTTLNNKAQVRYGDVIKETNESKLISENGDIRVSVKRVTDKDVDLYESGTVQYFAILENISDNKVEDVKVKTNLPSNYTVERTELITGMESEEVSDGDLYNTDNAKDIDNETINEETSTTNSSEESVVREEIGYEDLINIDSLDKGETKVLSYDMLINKNDNKNTNFSVMALTGNKEYKSNIIEDKINDINVSVSMTTNTQSEYLKSGDSLQYIINVKNNGTNRVEGVVLKDIIPDSLTVEKVTFDGEVINELENINEIEISCNIAANSEAIITIETVVDYSAARTSAEAITNVAYVELFGDKIATTQEINHIIKADENPINPNPDTPNPDVAQGDKMISGVAWFDENNNGQKDDGEKTLNNIKVHLLNTETNNLVKNANGNILEATTNENGLYVLDNLYSGKYIVIFEYNQTLYTLTKYRAENVEESKNSNVMVNELNISDQRQAVPSTDIIELNGNNISNVNIGLIELKDFAFRLDKFVNRILIQNDVGTTIKEYTNATVAKAELDSKKINGTNVIIEYEIRVTNIGEIDGYVRKVVDYMPNGLKFSSELNKDWYQTGSDLYNTSLANEKIKEGESRSLKLTLTKAMSEDNTGLINNTAEIAESYNELGIKDSKSTSSNKAQGESDYGSADTILSLKTGGDVYIAITAVIIAILSSIVFVIIIKKHKVEDIK